MPFIPTFESCESEKHANQQDASCQIWKVKGIRSHVLRWTTSVYTQHGSIVICDTISPFSALWNTPDGPTNANHSSGPGTPIIMGTGFQTYPTYLDTPSPQKAQMPIKRSHKRKNDENSGQNAPKKPRKSPVWRNQGGVSTQSSHNCRKHVDIGRFLRSCCRDGDYVLPVQRMCDAVELIIMRPERETFVENFAADFPSWRTAELEVFLRDVLRHRTRLISPITRWK